jgi:hypothetical protein
VRDSEYKLAGDIPEALRGTEQDVTVKGEDGKETTKRVRVPFVIKIREAETLDEFTANLVQDAKPDITLGLAQGQYDIVAQRKIREAANSDEIVGILSGKTVEIDGEKLDFSTASDEERVEHALSVLAKLGGSYVHGGRSLVTGSSQKRNAATGSAVAAAAKEGKLSPETIAELTKLGITL